MSYQALPPIQHGPANAVRQLAQLAQLHGLVQRIAGEATGTAQPDDALDRSARISAAYDDAMPVVRKRFDALAAETAQWAASGVEALLQGRSDAPPPRAAAARLAEELSQVRGTLESLLGF
ncbi:hypothetical protein [Allosphingosinicella indica]|uniref:Uncharacterized protein n=1 Tax=Allosphingosinicella indica TaxID=941907 RepID=A0A1X7FZA7_9SPHN|nr:hypothetical protein [Allosphingosinicella indica]SMF61448.1 hypothetical protein SAMN06295910_0436 [Allosphingosinicella indica]